MRRILPFVVLAMLSRPAMAQTLPCGSGQKAQCAIAVLARELSAAQSQIINLEIQLAIAQAQLQNKTNTKPAASKSSEKSTAVWREHKG
jgi:hypothetical protein